MKSRIESGLVNTTGTRVSRSTNATGSEPCCHKQVVPVPMRRVPRSVVVIGRQPQHQVLDAVANAPAFDVVFLEPLEQAYSKVKQVSPDLIVLWLPIDDLHACQVLSMLKLDQATSGIPLVTYDASCEQVSAATMN